MERVNRLMAFLVLILVATVSAGISVRAQEAAPAPASAPADVYAEIPGTRVSLHLPEGFELATGFAGILHNGFGAMVITNEINVPLDRVMAGMTEENPSADRPNWSRTEKVRVSGMDATMFHATEEDVDGAVRKWVVLFGNEKLTVMLAASAPALLESALGKTLEECLLTAKWDPVKKLDPYAGMGFSLRESEIFEIRGRRPGGILLARKGAPEELNPTEPIMVVYPSASVEIAPIAILAKRELTDGEQFTEFKNFAERPLTVNGLSGYEIVADAKEASMSIPVRIIMVVVRTPDQDMVIEGIVAPESWEKYLPEFHALAESFTLTAGGHGGH